MSIFITSTLYRRKLKHIKVKSSRGKINRALSKGRSHDSPRYTISRLNRGLLAPFLLFKDFIYLFLERGREGERKEETHPCVVVSYVPPLGTWPATQACAPTGI